MKTIYTIGYSGLKRDNLVRVARRLDLVVLDTRYSPKSRNAAWTKPSLERALGNRYAHVAELGNVNFRGGAIQIADPGAGLGRACVYLEKSSVVLLCVCGDVATCHRLPVSQLLAEHTGAPIVHWTPDEVADLANVDRPMQMVLF